jgi:hypothetical protein
MLLKPKASSRIAAMAKYLNPPASEVFVFTSQG